MPRLRMRDATGTRRTITRVRMRDAGNVLRTIQRVRMRDASGTLRTVFQYFLVTIPSSVLGSNSGASGHGSVTSSSAAATVTGGTAPYTYAWSRVSGDLSITIDTPTGSSTTFTADVYNAAPKDGLFKLTVTDNNGFVVESNTISVQLDWFDTR